MYALSALPVTGERTPTSLPRQWKCTSASNHTLVLPPVMPDQQGSATNPLGSVIKYTVHTGRFALL